MDDPFADLRKKRELYDEQKRRDKAEQEQAKQQAEQALMERKRLRKSYDSLVADVLERLGQAVYPELKAVRRMEEGAWQYSSADWYIGEWNDDSDCGPVGVRYGVEVLLVFDDNNKPKGFSCHLRPGGAIIVTGLSREQLIEGLKELFQDWGNQR